MNPYYPISKKTVLCLRKAGWNLLRSVEPKPAEIARLEKQFTVFPSALGILRHLGGLTVSYEGSRGTRRSISFGITDSTFGFSDWTQEKISYLERCAGERLCVVGDESAWAMLLLAGESGRVYGSVYGELDDLHLLGFTALTAVNALVNGTDYSSYKTLAPYHDDHLRDLLTRCKTIATTGFTETLSADQAQRAAVAEHFLRGHGYRVYTVNPWVSAYEGFPTYRRLADVPEQIDLVAWHHFADLDRIVDDAIDIHARAVISSYNGGMDPRQKARAERGGVQFIQGIAFINAYKRLILPHEAEE